MKTTLKWLIFCNILLGLTVGLGFKILLDQRHAGCENRNEAQRNGALILADAIVAANPEADQDRVDTFLADLSRRLEKAEVDC